MSTVPASSKVQKSKKEKEKEKEKDKERKGSTPPNERLKTVVRRLPPNLPEDIFWQSVQQWVTDETAIWKTFYQGKLRKKLNKENIPSRAYIAFKNEEQLALFSREYDGHVFRDKTGAESQAVVEFAPYPKIPSEKRKPDNRNATIEKDEDFISFVESLKAAENAEPVSLESLIASSQAPPPPKTTPLLEALKAEKSANRDKEAILRNHAHYTQINGGSSRKDEKKKASAPPPPSLPAKPAESAVPAPGGGKKSQKKTPAQGGTPGPAGSQNPKNPPVQAAKNAPAASNPPTNQGAKPGKPPRAPRPSPQPKHAANLPVITLPPPGGVLLQEGQASPITPSPRRARPVIGLASRQFEAALSGVAGLASAATERKRREKEREAQAQAQNAAAGPSTSTAAAAVPAPAVAYARIDDAPTDKPALPPPAPPSPKKEKTRHRGRGGPGAPHNAAAAAGPSADAPQVKVPSILQRADGPPPGILQKDGSVDAVPPAGASSSSVPVGSSPLNPTGNQARGGGRRGRGGGAGGRGRGGGAPNAPRGG